jgi:hypothetical protein
MINYTSSSPLKTAVLFLVFNRPRLTLKSFEAIRKAKPLKFYVACDGPRPEKKGEETIVAEVQKIVNQIDWPCEVKKLFQPKNLGCSNGVANAITWFFEHEEQGIIIEDDNLVHPDFFYFCETLLNKYKDNLRISTISGDNFQNGNKRGEATYYFSKYFGCWGWATWKREWKFYDKKINFWPQWKLSKDWINKFPDKVERKYWENIFNIMYETDFDSWAYRFLASIMHRGKLNIFPNVNLVSNIGFGEDATHTKKADNQESNIPTQSLGKIIHPKLIEINYDADKYHFEWSFGGRNLQFPRSWAIMPKRILYFIFRKISQSIKLYFKFSKPK